VNLLANIWGPDAIIVIAVIALLFGGTQLPKLARSLGSASHEFRKGVEEGHAESAEKQGEKQRENPGS
jgi:sec-independent protein translocase protein TatA